jgi:hypothetical protein
MSAFSEDKDREEETCYLVTPSYKKSVYEELMYTKYYGDTRVSLKVTKVWRYGEFHVDLTNLEAKEIVKLDEVNLNKYCTEVVCTDNLYDYEAEVIDIDKYDKDLQKQINLDVFDDDEYPYDDCELVDERDWELDDTLYSIVGGVEIDNVKSEDESENESEDESEHESEHESIAYVNTVGGKIVGGSFEPPKEDKEETYKLCENVDCERYPPDWDFEEDTESTYQEGQWRKCCLCDGYFDDDGFGDILFVQEEPNNQEAECDLCGKTKNIVQMKGCGQYLCEAACDESEEEEEDENKDKDNDKGEDKEDKNEEDKDENKEEDEDEINKCDECSVDLDRYRDGSTDKDVRCNNCYWEDKEGKDSSNIIKPDYRKKEEEEEEDDTNCAVYYNEYRCKHCDSTTASDDPDCYICGKKFCMLLVQVLESDDDDYSYEYNSEPEYNDEDEDDNIKEEAPKKKPWPTFSPLTEEQLEAKRQEKMWDIGDY